MTDESAGKKKSFTIEVQPFGKGGKKHIWGC